VLFVESLDKFEFESRVHGCIPGGCFSVYKQLTHLFQKTYHPCKKFFWGRWGDGVIRASKKESGNSLT
ncbi:MAG: hypothetical protein ACK4ZT_13195, partial [Microcystis sp.]|uniref:hypothetical protein n=1 Tax=Microcystis sp. TaxID=1127 RepID=UPI003918D546